MPKIGDPGEPITGVYCWVNTVNGKVYVGGAYQPFFKRFRYYRWSLARGLCHNRHLQSAWDLYGSKAFRLRILERCPPHKVQEREQYWIDKLQAADRHHGYNICPMAGSSAGTKLSEETKAKMSAARKGRRGTFTGHKHTAESKAKMSASLKGKPGPRKGVKHTEEAKAKISASHKARHEEGKTRSRLTGEKRSSPLKGRPLSEAHKANLSAALKGRRLSEAHKAKLSAAKMRSHWTKGPNAEEIKARTVASRQLSNARRAALTDDTTDE